MVSITLDTNKDGHKDLYFQCDLLKINNKLDSYYFALDIGILPEEETYEKAWIVLKQLVSNWISALEKADQPLFFLPIDFSDEYVGFLKVRLTNNSCYISYGGTQKYQGHGFIITDTKSLDLEDEDYFISHEEVSISLKDLIDNIRIEKI